MLEINQDSTDLDEKPEYMPSVNCVEYDYTFAEPTGNGKSALFEEVKERSLQA